MWPLLASYTIHCKYEPVCCRARPAAEEGGDPQRSSCSLHSVPALFPCACVTSVTCASVAVRCAAVVHRIASDRYGLGDVLIERRTHPRHAHAHERRRVDRSLDAHALSMVAASRLCSPRPSRRSPSSAHPSTKRCERTAAIGGLRGSAHKIAPSSSAVSPPPPGPVLGERGGVGLRGCVQRFPLRGIYSRGTFPPSRWDRPDHFGTAGTRIISNPAQMPFRRSITFAPSPPPWSESGCSSAPFFASPTQALPPNSAKYLLRNECASACDRYHD